MQKIIIGGLYRHFKGMYYYVSDIATHSETGEAFVVYRQLYGKRETYIRPLFMFAGEVDRAKYPQVTQKYRFALMSGIDEKNEE